MPGTVDPLRDAPKTRVPEVRGAYKFLVGTHATVVGIVNASSRLAEARRDANGTTAGRLLTEEVDLLRSAIVMTSSGIDASMQRIIWDAGRYLVPIAGSLARKQYELEIKQALSIREGKVDEHLKAAIVEVDPAASLLNYYLAGKARASFQGSGDLKKRVRNALGVANAAVPDADLESLDPFFRARNQISHAMDYEDPRNVSGRKRTHRSVDDVTEMCNNAFRVAANLLHAVADVLVTSRPKR